MGGRREKRKEVGVNRGKLHNNVLYFAIEKGQRKKEEAKKKKGDRSRECKAGFVSISPPLPLSTDPPLL